MGADRAGATIVAAITGVSVSASHAASTAPTPSHLMAGTVALVTGAASGIGRAAALALAREGAAVAALGRTGADLDDIVAVIRSAGGEAISIVADIVDAAAMAAALETIGTTWGRLDTVFANAGINGVWAPLDDLTLAEWEHTLHVNLTGTFITVQTALPLLRARGGSVIITSSVNGTRNFSNTGATAYSVSKAGQLAFAKMIALELAPQKIRVNVICPGAVDTDINEKTTIRDVDRVRIPVEYPRGSHPLLGSPAEPEDIAPLVVFLASDAARHISGTELWIDGAESLLRG